MNLPYYIARRYLFSKKKHNAINIISAISVCGVALATLALVCTLSVFNGFQDMVASFFTAFDPELKITARQGKVFDSKDPRIVAIASMPEVSVFTHTLEEQAMVEYKDRHAMAVIKGVDDNFAQLTEIETILYGGGNFTLHDEVVDYAVMGIELVSMLGTGIRFVDPLSVYAPRREKRVNMSNPSASFQKRHLFSPGSVFIVNQAKYDSQYILTSMKFARDLFSYETEVSAIELKLAKGVQTEAFKQRLQQTLGDDFLIQNRYEQQADTLRIMEIEKFISYLFLIFILVIASFNVIGSLSMLMLDKRENVSTLRSLGASNRLITHIFLFEGWMISLFGALSGIVIGVVLCLLQQQFGLISLGEAGGSFLVDAYPVSVRAGDIVLIFVTVVTIGLLSVWY
ncbi:FtsX-like permease family protein, partial [Bacteroides sp. OttesenSCG-928-D19]|nr:FtsX-like permease family protein [Bacteroides sp. OttesenSCG-928-N06]MDL2305662.1 FtsX-like permease family protein [Bacteroides sp. OttesenSCG-928-D19]